jgi:uncharacterized protein
MITSSAKITNRLKPSNYNYFVHVTDDIVLGYNFIYRSIIRVPHESFSELNSLLNHNIAAGVNLDGTELDKLSLESVESLRTTGFLIDEEINELDVLKHRYYRNLFDSQSLSLVVLPTLWCNLNCPYCFEYKKPLYMSLSTQDNLLEWVKKHFSGKREVHVAWFGGEPLLAKDTIINLTSRFQQFCKEIGAKYTASVTTNGFFLDRSFQERLPLLDIKHVQVTFDGDKPEHDSLRIQRNGQGSFDQIFANVLSFCDSKRDAKLTIRVNCGDNSYAGIPHLLEKFPKTVLENTTIFFRWIWANKACDYKEFSIKERGHKPFLGLAKLYEIAGNLGWKTRNPHNDITDCYCEVDYLDHFDIGPEGNVFLCTHTFAENEALGSLTDNSLLPTPKAVQKYTKWYGANPWSDPACISCKLLPVCWGGCRQSRVSGNRACIEEKSSIDQYVMDTIKTQLASSFTDAKST